jgi:hypothetical protein
MTISAPRWDLTNIYPSLESKEFKASIVDYKKQATSLEKLFKTKISKADAKTPAMPLTASTRSKCFHTTSVDSFMPMLLPTRAINWR